MPYYIMHTTYSRECMPITFLTPWLIKVIVKRTLHERDCSTLYRRDHAHAPPHIHHGMWTTVHAPRHMHHHTCTMAYGLRRMHHATCSMAHAPRHMHHGACTTTHAPWRMHHHTCTMPHAHVKPVTLYSPSGKLVQAQPRLF